MYLEVIPIEVNTLGFVTKNVHDFVKVEQTVGAILKDCRGS